MTVTGRTPSRFIMPTQDAIYMFHKYCNNIMKIYLKSLFVSLIIFFIMCIIVITRNNYNNLYIAKVICTNLYSTLFLIMVYYTIYYIYCIIMQIRTSLHILVLHGKEYMILGLCFSLTVYMLNYVRWELPFYSIYVPLVYMVYYSILYIVATIYATFKFEKV